jgi:hypothetical protein
MCFAFEGKKLKTDEEACCRPRKMEGVHRGPSNAVRHHGEEKEGEVFCLSITVLCF